MGINKKISKIDSINHYLKMVNAAVYGLDIPTGAVQVYIGGNNHKYLPYNLIKSERQAASLFKPFVYTSALENGQAPCDWINNKVKIYTDYDNWKPENHDHSEGGYYSMPGALAKSMNIPTVKTYMNLGNTKVEETVRTLGLKSKLDNLPSTALGSSTYSLQSLVHAYTAFATRNKIVKPYFIQTIKTSKGEIIYQHNSKKHISKIQSISTTTLETMQYMLKGVVEKGTARKLTTKYSVKNDWAGKTGTSQNYSDSWFIGFNSKFIIGTWVGCKYPIINLPPGAGGGSVAALPIIASVISKSYNSEKINNTLSSGFPVFKKSVVKSCNCDFFREENTLEKLFDLFNREEKQHRDKKKGFFSRLFNDD
jgi:penicillin-binding protein 1A